ncbi:hypothetical protein [Nonomuraea dietziae]|uniref:hypothetical protein n=1 Tax=Nonomuraea dietziae TaxID=65515 RepID=UPI0031E051D4
MPLFDQRADTDHVRPRSVDGLIRPPPAPRSSPCPTRSPSPGRSCWRRGAHPLKARSWWWLAVAPALCVGPALMGESKFPVGVVRAVAELGLLAAAVCAARMARDPRWGVAALVYLLVGHRRDGRARAVPHRAASGLLGPAHAFPAVTAVLVAREHRRNRPALIPRRVISLEIS